MGNTKRSIRLKEEAKRYLNHVASYVPIDWVTFIASGELVMEIIVGEGSSPVPSMCYDDYIIEKQWKYGK